MVDKPIPIPLFKTGNGCESCDQGDRPKYHLGRYVHHWADFSRQDPYFDKPCTNPLLRKRS